jgi:hypothetical protein
LHLLPAPQTIPTRLPPRGDVRVSGRAHARSWVYQRRLTGRLWNTASCFTAAPLTSHTGGREHGGCRGGAGSRGGVERGESGAGGVEAKSGDASAGGAHGHRQHARSVAARRRSHGGTAARAAAAVGAHAVRLRAGECPNPNPNPVLAARMATANTHAAWQRDAAAMEALLHAQQPQWERTLFDYELATGAGERASTEWERSNEVKGTWAWLPPFDEWASGRVHAPSRLPCRECREWL